MEDKRISVTIEDARSIIGGKAKKMSDEEIQQLVIHLTFIARWALMDARDSHQNK
jgi:hypothetical protein